MQGKGNQSLISRCTLASVGGADALQSDFDVIERNHYDVFRQRAYVPRMQQIRTLPVAWLRSQVL